MAGVRVAQWVKSLDLTAHTSLSPIWRGFALSFVNYKKGCTRLAAAIDKVYQLLARGRWFSPGTPPSSTTKTGRHDIAEILMKVVLNTKNQINQTKTRKSMYTAYTQSPNSIVKVRGPLLSNLRHYENSLTSQIRVSFLVRFTHYVLEMSLVFFHF